jgi:hypothetical protein
MHYFHSHVGANAWKERQVIMVDVGHIYPDTEKVQAALDTLCEGGFLQSMEVLDEVLYKMGSKTMFDMKNSCPAKKNGFDGCTCLRSQELMEACFRLLHDVFLMQIEVQIGQTIMKKLDEKKPKKWFWFM